MGEIAAIFLGACLVNNLVLDAMLGLPATIATSKKISTAIGMSAAMALAVIITTVITYPLYYYFLLPADMEYLNTICFLLIMVLGIKAGEISIAIFKPLLYEKIVSFIPLTLINSAVLGTALLNIQKQHGIAGSLIYGAGFSAGLALVLVSLAAMQDILKAPDIPSPFQGIAITLITLGIMSMAFMGFTGIVNF